MNSRQLLALKSETLGILLSDLVNKHSEVFSKCAEIISEALQSSRTIFWCGNGGSAAESSHLAAELIGRFKSNRKPLPSISLNSDTSAITCIANDFGYEEVFARQLKGLAKKHDVLIVLSTSGVSKNICRVLQAAKELGVTSISLLGKGGGTAPEFSDFSIIIDSQETARIQEIHLLIGHIFCEYAEIKLGFENGYN